jgi:hypothetical protein
MAFYHQFMALKKELEALGHTVLAVLPRSLAPVRRRGGLIDREVGARRGDRGRGVGAGASRSVHACIVRTPRFAVNRFRGSWRPRPRALRAETTSRVPARSGFASSAFREPYHELAPYSANVH